jgi:hypothetical protein
LVSAWAENIAINQEPAQSSRSDTQKASLTATPNSEQNKTFFYSRLQMASLSLVSAL